MFNDVFDAYVDFSAYGLMRKTHAEAPWRNTNIGPGNVIKHQELIDFFKKKIGNA